MGESEDRIKASFNKVKEHIEALEQEIFANREFIIQQNAQIKSQNDQILTLLDQTRLLDTEFQSKNKDNLSSNLENKGKISFFNNNSPLDNEISKSKKGVSLDGYSLPGYSLPGYSLNIQTFQEELPMILSRISRQEFLTFLTVYQQEEDIGQVTYESVAKELNISPGCVRTYISGLIKKGLPVVKTKYNNKIIILTIPSEIRGLNIKKRLIQTFYNQDPSQKKLGDLF